MNTIAERIDFGPDLEPAVDQVERVLWGLYVVGGPLLMVRAVVDALARVTLRRNARNRIDRPGFSREIRVPAGGAVVLPRHPSSQHDEVTDR